MSKLRYVLIALVLPFELLSLESDRPPFPSTMTLCGPVRGTYLTSREGRTFNAFMGIPYGKPPVGPLRFEPPEPTDPWNGVLPTDKQPFPCLQFWDIRSVEDCLYLNVFTPDLNPGQLLPVLVFIPGGESEIGGVNEFTPEYFLDKDMVLVVIQYRLGLLGFLSTGDEVVPGNMFLKDIRLALRWVKANIKNFGGNPKKVTIGGESAGAAFVHLLMMFQGDEGLFQAGISQSASAFNPWVFKTSTEMKSMVRNMSKLTGCPSNSEGFVDCLKMKPKRDVLNLLNYYKDSLKLGTSEQILHPLLGPVLEPECVEDRIITGNFWNYNVTIPWLVSVTMALLNPSNLVFHHIDASLDRRGDVLMFYQNSAADGTKIFSTCKQFYLNNEPISRRTLSAAVDMLSDGYIIYGIYEAILRASKNSTYLYYYDYIGANEHVPITKEGRIGAGHANDMWLFWPHPYHETNTRIMDTEEDTILSKKLIDLWFNFMTYHDPTPEEYEGLKWVPFHPNNSYLNITREGKFQMGSDFLKERMEFWQNVPYPFRDDYIEPIPCKYMDHLNLAKHLT